MERIADMRLHGLMGRRFPSGFFKKSIGSLGMEILPSGLPKIVGDNEDLARFLTSSKQCKGGVVKYFAFLPHPEHRNKSVFRHGAEPRDALHGIAKRELPATQSLHGAAICKAVDIRNAKLEALA